MQGEDEDAESTEPSGRAYAKADDDLYEQIGTPTSMAGNAIGTVGGGSAHNNMQPYLALNYIIALVGLYPSRS
jgi:microcystin-dependent protein